jgi:ferritin-like metal-binding protein YciE
MKPELLEDVYFSALQQTLEGERASLEALPRMAEMAPPELAELFKKHAEETQRQLQRLEQCLRRFETKGERPMKPQAVVGAIAEMREHLALEPDPELAAVIIGAGARKIEHLEIACYADLLTFAKALRLEDQVRLLAETLQEERRMEELLASLAETTVEEAAALAETA